MTKEQQEAHRLYHMMRAEIKPFHDPKYLHTSVMSICSETIDLVKRSGGDEKYWYQVRLELAKIEDPGE